MRRQLPLPRPYIAPRNLVEEVLAEIWRAALNMDCVGVEDDITDLGGDSFDATVIFAMIEEKFGVHVPVSTLIGAPTIASLAREVERVRASLT
jgi:acyl carrier protein